MDVILGHVIPKKMRTKNQVLSLVLLSCGTEKPKDIEQLMHPYSSCITRNPYPLVAWEVKFPSPSRSKRSYQRGPTIFQDLMTF